MTTRFHLPRLALTAGAAAALGASALTPQPAHAYWLRHGWGWRPAPVLVAPAPVVVAPPVYVVPVNPYAPVRAVWVPGHYNHWGRWIPGHYSRW